MPLRKGSIGSFSFDAPLGIGTMFWGETFVDSLFCEAPAMEDLLRIVNTAQAAGVKLFDTAEGYGGGSSELRLGAALGPQADAVVMTKFIPACWRWTEGSFFHALSESRKRLGRPIDVFYIHTPVHPLFEFWVECACKARARGLVTEIGLSNCGAAQVKKAVDIAKRLDQRIAANQVLFSLLSYRSSALKDMERVCRDNDITIVAYSVLGQGLLTDNLTREKFGKTRAAKMTGVKYEELQELRGVIAALAARHERTMAQVCLNWAIQKGAIPLVGCKNVRQLQDSLGCLQFSLSEEEVRSLDSAALPCATLDKSPVRRGVFVVLISVLIMFYYVTRWVPLSWFRRSKQSVKQNK